MAFFGLWTGVAAAALGCAQPAPPAPFEFTVRVESDPGRALAGAQVTVSGKLLASTATDGRAQIAVPGAEGDTVDVLVKCPEGFSSPARPISVTLKRLADNKRPEYPASCPPSLRRVVLAVRAENGPNLPVKYFGKEVARTDASGAAHYMVDAHPGDQIEIVLATNERGAEGLRPQNPTFSYVVKPQDEVVLFDARFQVERKAAPPAPTRRIPREIPQER